MKLETLETKHLFLKKLTPAIFKDLFENYSETYVMRLLGLKNHEEYIKQKEKSDGGYQTYDRTIAAFLMVLKTTDQTIGRCGYHNWYPQHKRAEIGYVIFDEVHRGQGYMNEALQSIIDYGFNRMDLNRIEAFAGPNNAPSVHLIEKYGFKREGYLRQHYLRDDVMEDSLVFSFLKSDVDS
jgi:ribosomal-protein-alanine N-acetyltransferase